jgi:hypothetical protein
MQSQKTTDYVSFGIHGLCYFPAQMKAKSFYKNSYKYSVLVVKSTEINAYEWGYSPSKSAFMFHLRKREAVLIN